MLLNSMFFRKDEDDDIFDVDMDDAAHARGSNTAPRNNAHDSLDDHFADPFGEHCGIGSRIDADTGDSTAEDAHVSDDTRDMISSVLSSISSGNIGNVLNDIEHAEELATLPPDPFADMDIDATSANDEDGGNTSMLSAETSRMHNEDKAPERNGKQVRDANANCQQPAQRPAIAPKGNGALNASASNQFTISASETDDANDSVLRPTPEEESYRTVARSVIALHYYYASGCNWLLALDQALREVPALCLAFPHSPVNYHSLADADEVARRLGYRDYEHIAREAESLTASSQALARFGEETSEWASRFWFQCAASPADIGLLEYVDAIRNDLRGAWPMSKINAAQFAAMMSENGEADDEPGLKTLDDGSRVRFIGVNGISEKWNPESLITQPEDRWEAAHAVSDAMDVNARMQEFDASSERLEELVSLAYLQCYQWSGRSWNKAVDEANRFCECICTYAWSSASSEFSLPDLETTRARVQRMDELAAILANDEGNIELRTMTGADGRTYLDIESAEFKALYDEQKRVEAEYSVQMIVESLVHDMMNPEGSVASCVVDYVLTRATSETGGKRDEKAQLAVIESVKDDVLRIMDSKSKAFKSQWKKYLSAHKDDAAKIRNGYVITGFEDGELRFGDKAPKADAAQAQAE